MAIVLPTPPTVTHNFVNFSTIGGGLVLWKADVALVLVQGPTAALEEGV